jgi:hypothetical protein
VGLPAFAGFLGDRWRSFDAITFAGDGDDVGVMQEAVDDGSSDGHVTEEFAPFLQWPIAGLDGGAIFVTAHDDLQPVFAGVSGQLLEPPPGRFLSKPRALGPTLAYHSAVYF